MRHHLLIIILGDLLGAEGPGLLWDVDHGLPFVVGRGHQFDDLWPEVGPGHLSGLLCDVDRHLSVDEDHHLLVDDGHHLPFGIDHHRQWNDVIEDLRCRHNLGPDLQFGAGLHCEAREDLLVSPIAGLHHLKIGVLAHQFTVGLHYQSGGDHQKGWGHLLNLLDEEKGSLNFFLKLFLLWNLFNYDVVSLLNIL